MVRSVPEIQITYFTGTTSASGNTSYTFDKNIRVLAAYTQSQSDVVITAFPSGSYLNTWWFHCIGSGSSYTPIANASLRIYIAYVYV